MGALSAVVGWSLRNRPLVVAAALLLVVAGVRAALELRLDATPDLTPVQVQVVTSAPALSPVEIEQYVTLPVERALTSTPRSRELRSLSKYGFSMVTLTFEDGTDVLRARQLVAERLPIATAQIPPRYGRPQLAPPSTALGEIYQFVVRSDGLTPMKRRELLDWYIGPQLRSVPGVVDVASQGGEEREYQIVLDGRRLAASGVTVAQVAEAVERANGNVGGGYLERSREQVIVGSDGQVRGLDDLRKVVVATPANSPPLTVGALGDVRFGPRLRRGAATRDGEGEVVVGVVIMQLGDNARRVTAAVKERLQSLAPSLPPGTRIEPFYDRSVLVDHTVATMARNLVEGAALVVLVLLAILGDLRAGIAVAAIIPLALLFALVVMEALGLSGNLMSLGAIDFGLMVDGAVIIVENCVRRLNEAQAERAASGTPLDDEARRSVIQEATAEVRAASLFGEAIIAIVYLPILALTGVEGKLFLPMATTVLLALGGAFVLSLTLVPVLASWLVRPHARAREPWLFRLADRLYAPTLAAATRRRTATMLAGVGALALAVALFARLGSDFVPTLDEGDLLIEVRRLPGVALTQALAIDERVERALKQVPEVSHVVGKLGAPEMTTDPMGIDQTDVYVALTDRKQWRHGVDRAGIARAVAEQLEAEVPDAAAGISQPIQMRTNELVAGLRSDVAALIYGDDLGELARVGEEVARVVRTVPGAADVRVEQVAGLAYLRVVPDRDALARYGLSVADVNELVETVSAGAPVGVVFEGDRRFNAVLKVALDGGTDAASNRATDLDGIRALPLEAPGGALVPLGAVADVHVAEGPAEIAREGGSRRLAVELNVRGRDLVSVVDEARKRVAAKVHPPVGYRVEWGGQFEHYEAGKRRLAIVVPVALGLIVLCLWLAFRSARVVAMVSLGVPLAVVGGVIALALRGLPFSISAGIGFIALAGVAILNGLVLVAAAVQLEERGATPAQAIDEAARRRLRPVLMTALVAALGFVPMALSTAPGSEVQRPLATVVIGGVVSAALLTLVVLPAPYGALKREA